MDERKEHGVVRDRDGDIWVESHSGMWTCTTSSRSGPISQTLKWVEHNYGPLEYPRWVQVVHDE